MEFTYNKHSNLGFGETIQRVKELLSEEGFGVISEIDLKDKFKEKLDINFRNYTILGACNPGLAYKAVEQEDHIGVMLPCNVLVQEHEDGKVEVSAINPLQSIGAIGKESLKPLAEEVGDKLKAAIEKV